MKDGLLVVQIVIALMLSGAILLQTRGTGLGTAFGGSNEQYRSKRGIEKLLFRMTFVLLSLFLITSVINLLVR